MDLPRVETCCFVFDLHTGNLIMGGINAVGSFTLAVIMIAMTVMVGQIPETGDIEIDAPTTGLYVMCILLTLMYTVRFLFDIYFIYGVIIEKASIIKAYVVVWIIIFIMSSSIFLMNLEHFNAGVITTQVLYLVASVTTIVISHSYYKQLNCREEL